MKKICGYAALFFYSCFSSIIMLIILGAGISGFYYIKSGFFNFPLSQIKRAIVFGCIAGTAITVAAIVFNLIDYFKARKSSPSAPK
ncbi:hypothetical protein [Erwinia phyllosphaerae]|uniref:hypothetical protein n=1 Tax=Erwinia phyllosphaerae TaxID=2853256 RepID=UPI001FEF8A99|nr:hypothetical protein [Erwinia phyllosphaerae]MBV4365788.1 hypothetical protein [Erwinia phyllosphaerae]